MQFIIHPGCPRTGTTTLQSHIFKKANKTLIFQKKPYQASFQQQGKSRGKSRSKEKIFNQIIEYTRLASIPIEASNSAPIVNLLNELQENNQSVLFSTERLVDTGASLSCFSEHKRNVTNIYPIHPLIKALKKSRFTPLISICFRNGTKYLRSKYVRTLMQRESIKERFLRPQEYIQKQSILETSYPGTSALTPAMHSEFIKQLQKHAFVKAFGFKELLASDDVFSLMGLQGEDKYAFRDFPRENKFPITKEQEQAIEIEITQALKQYGFYDRVMKAQMFE